MSEKLLLAVGDIVTLKSGGPPMVIALGSDKFGWLCHWFDVRLSAQSERYMSYELKESISNEN